MRLIWPKMDTKRTRYSHRAGEEFRVELDLCPRIAFTPRFRRPIAIEISSQDISYSVTAATGTLKRLPFADERIVKLAEHCAL